MTTNFKKTVLYTDKEGRSKFREDEIAMVPSGVIGFLSELLPSGGYQLRHSPVGYENSFHCTTTPQWVFVLGGVMEIELADGSKRQFKAGESFYSEDTLPTGATFTKGVHGHISRQVGNEPLRTLFVRG